MANIKDFTEYANFQDKQLDAWYTLLSPQCKYLLYGGAASGGKSYFLRWAAVGLGLYYYSRYHIPNITMGLFSSDYPTLKDRQVIKMKNEIPAFFGEVKDSRDEGYSFISRPEFGSFVILLRNLDDPSKYKSAEFAAILVEELTENTETTFDDLRFRLRFPGVTDVKFVGVTNPGSVGHGFVKKKWVKPDLTHPDFEQNRFFFIPARYDDNQFTTPDYVRQLQSLPEDKRRAYMEGDWNIFAGQFFPEFRDDLHVCKPFIPKEKLTIIGGMDWGRTKPFACSFSVVKPEVYEEVHFNRVITFMEVYGTDKTPKEWAEEIVTKLKGFGIKLSDVNWIQADPSIFTPGNDGSISIRDQFVSASEDFRCIKKGSNDRVGGWENMHNWLTLAPDGVPYWLLTENCINGIRTLPELVHDDLKVEDVMTQGEDHWGDQARYMLKALKWIDARVGGISFRQPQKRRKTFANMTKSGRQVSMNTDRFALTRHGRRKVVGSI